jgi:hypothetical protein
MPQHQDYPLAEHREDENPKYYDEEQKDVARMLAAHPPKAMERGHKYID